MNEPNLTLLELIAAKGCGFVAAWRELAKHTYRVSLDGGQFTGDTNDGEKIALMHSELSEALEGLRHDRMDDKLTHRKQVEVELADCIIRIMNYAEHRGLDIPGALVEKALFNATRNWKQEGKKF